MSKLFIPGVKYRAIFIITFLGFSISAYNQETLEKKFSDDVCNCLNQVKNVTIDDLGGCFEEGVRKNQKLFSKQAFKLYKDTSYEAGRKLGQELGQQVSISMVRTCDTYYKMMDTLRYASLKGLNTDSIKNAIQELNKKDEKTWDQNFLSQRGLLYFQLMDLENALKDFDKSLDLDPENIQSIYYKGWSHELLKDYDKAILCYAMMQMLTNKNEFKIFVAIANQKKILSGNK